MSAKTIGYDIPSGTYSGTERKIEVKGLITVAPCYSQTNEVAAAEKFLDAYYGCMFNMD